MSTIEERVKQIVVDSLALRKRTYQENPPLLTTSAPILWIPLSWLWLWKRIQLRNS